MQASEWIAIVVALLVVLWGARQVYLMILENRALKAELRRLNYELMEACVKWRVDRERLLAAVSTQRAKRAAAAAAAAEEIKGLKQGVEDALELLAIYRAIGIEPANTPLPDLRDRLSQFGRLMESEVTMPGDLAERSEWSGFK